MNYQSPIEIIQTQFQTQCEAEIYKAVCRVGVSVDKEELLKALTYDRGQYEKGYKDKDAEIVRCKDCIHRPKSTRPLNNMIGFDLVFPDNKCPCQCSDDGRYSWYPADDWFCADGKKDGGQMKRHKETFWDSLSEADLMEPMRHFKD